MWASTLSRCEGVGIERVVQTALVGQTKALLKGLKVSVYALEKVENTVAVDVAPF